MKPIEIVVTSRGPSLNGTRLTVYDVLHYQLGGWSATRIALHFRVSTAEIEAMFRYIDEHRDEVMAVHREIEERIARGNPPEVEAKLAGIRGTARRMRDVLDRNRAGANGDGHPG